MDEQNKQYFRKLWRQLEEEYRPFRDVLDPLKHKEQPMSLSEFDRKLLIAFGFEPSGELDWELKTEDVAILIEAENPPVGVCTIRTIKDDITTYYGDVRVCDRSVANLISSLMDSLKAHSERYSAAYKTVRGLIRAAHEPD